MKQGINAKDVFIYGLATCAVSAALVIVAMTIAEIVKSLL